MPRGRMLEKLMVLTGLTVQELLPDPHKQELKRLKEEKRRRDIARGIHVKRMSGRTKRTWTVLKGKAKIRSLHGKRTARH